MDIWKSRSGKSQAREEQKREDQRRKKSRRKEDASARKGSKVEKHCVFPLICGSGGSKSRLVKGAGAAGAEPCGSDERWQVARRCGAKHIWKSSCTKHTMFGPLLEVEMSKKCTPLWREARLQVKKLKTLHVRSTFGSWDVEKVHAVVARSTFGSPFGSPNVQNTPASDHFWKLMSKKVHAVVARSTFRNQKC